MPKRRAIDVESLSSRTRRADDTRTPDADHSTRAAPVVMTTASWLRLFALGLLVAPSGCKTSTPVAPASGSDALPPTRATQPSPESVPDDTPKIAGIAALNDQTCVWTEGGQAVCASAEGMNVIPMHDIAELAVRTKGYVVRTTDARVYELHPDMDPKELPTLAGASKVACSRHFCAALVGGQLMHWVFSFRDIDRARDGDELADFTIRNGQIVGLRHDGEIRSFGGSGYNDGKVLAASGSIVGDCVVDEERRLRCGNAPPAAVPAGLQLTTGVGVLRNYLPRNRVREVCGIERGSVICLGPPLGHPREKIQAYAWTKVPGLDDAATVVGGGRHACALTRAGRLKCWGAYDRGQYGLRLDTKTPAPVDDPGLDDPDAQLLLTGDRVCLVGKDASACSNPHHYRWEPFDVGTPESVSRDGDVVLSRDGRQLSATDPWDDERSRARLPRGITGVRRFVNCTAASYFLFDDGTLSATDTSNIAYQVDAEEEPWPPMHTLGKVPKVRDLVDIACTSQGLVSLGSSGAVWHHDAGGTPREHWFDDATAIVSAGPTVCATEAGTHRCLVLGKAGPTSVDDPQLLRGYVDLRGRTDWRLPGDDPPPRDRLCGRTKNSVRCIVPAAKLGTVDVMVTDTQVPGAIREYAVGPSHACARLEDDRVSCWGAASQYRLGRSIVHDEPIDVTDRFMEALAQ